MAHDEHMAGLPDQFHQGVAGNAGADLAPAVCLLGAAAEEGKVQTVFDNCLVTAAAQGHLDGKGSKIVTFFKISAVNTQAEGNGGRQAGRVDHLMDILQQGELLLLGMLQMPLFKHQQVTVSLQLAQQAVIGLRPGGDGIVDLSIHGGNGGFGQVHGQFLVVIHQNNGHHRTGTDILIPDLIHFRQIAQVQNAEIGAHHIVCPDGTAVNTVAAGADGHIVGILGLAGSQPVHADAGQHIGNILLGDLLAVAGNGGKPVAGPDDAVIPQPDQRHGQGIFRNFAGDIRGSGGILDKCLDLTAATPPIQKIAGE